MSVHVVQSVWPGRIKACSVSTQNLGPTFSLAITLEVVTQALCVRMGFVLELINTISTNGTKQLVTKNKTI